MSVGIALGAFGLGATLALLPGPVQFLLLSEATRGGVRRGVLAQVGANGTFAITVLALAGGLSAFTPSTSALRVLQVVGGAFLIALAADSMISAARATSLSGNVATGGAGPLVRGALAMVLNPAAWIFLATTASALFASALNSGGRSLALLSALAMLLGAVVIDGLVVLLGGGFAHIDLRITRWVIPVLACGLAAFGTALVIAGIRTR